MEREEREVVEREEEEREEEREERKCSTRGLNLLQKNKHFTLK